MPGIRGELAERASYAAMDVVAGVGVPLIKDGRWVASFGVHQATPRQWKPEELDLIRETAERTWAAVEHARTEAALAASEQRFRTLIEATSVVTWSYAASGQFVETQPQWSAFTGQSTSEMLGAGYTTAFHPDDADNATARLADAVARDVPYFNELRIRRHRTYPRSLLPAGMHLLLHRVRMCCNVIEIQSSSNDRSGLEITYMTNVGDRYTTAPSQAYDSFSLPSEPTYQLGSKSCCHSAVPHGNAGQSEAN